MTKQQFDIGTYFTIQYYAKKHDKIVIRRAQFTEDCEYGNHKFLVFHISDTLMLMQTELDVLQDHGK